MFQQWNSRLRPLTSAAYHTKLDDDGDDDMDRHIHGDSDIYGLGIRLGHT